jgi:hypothetical protein
MMHKKTAAVRWANNEHARSACPAAVQRPTAAGTIQFLLQTTVYCCQACVALGPPRFGQQHQMLCWLHTQHVAQAPAAQQQHNLASMHTVYPVVSTPYSFTF